MAVILNIDTTSQSNQNQRFIIDNRVLYINTRWNRRSGWFISIYDQDNVPLVQGIKIMPNRVDLLARYRYMEILPGWLINADTNPKKVDDEGITFTNFGQGKRWQLVYLSLDDIAQGGSTAVI